MPNGWSNRKSGDYNMTLLQTVAGNHTNLHTPKNHQKKRKRKQSTIPPWWPSKDAWPNIIQELEPKVAVQDSDSCSRKVENCGDKNPRSGNAGGWLPCMPSMQFFHVLEFRICNLFQKHLPQRIKPPHLATAIEFRQKLLRHTEWEFLFSFLFSSFSFSSKKKHYNAVLSGFLKGFPAMSQIKELPEFFSMQTSHIKELEYEDELSQNSLARIAPLKKSYIGWGW